MILLFMTIECSQSVHSIVIQKNEEGGDLDGRKKAKGSLCGSFGIFVAKNQIFFAAMTCPESFPNRTPSVLTGCHVIIFLKEPDIAPDVGVADFLADRLDRISSVGQQREGTFRAVAV